MPWLAKFKNLKIFCQKTHFFRNYPKIRTFWEVLLFQSHFTTILLSLAILKNSCFFRKTSSSFSIKIDFGTFWGFLLFLSHSTAKLLNLAHFLNLKTIFPKTHLCFKKNQNLNVLRSPNFFGRIPLRFCYL